MKANRAARGPRHKTLESSAKPRDTPLRVSELSGRTLQIVNHVLNSIALDPYGDHCSINALAKAFNSRPGLLRAPLRRLADSGLITIEGSPFPTVYPTVKLLMDQDPKLSLAADAQDILRRLRRRRRA